MTGTRRNPGGRIGRPPGSNRGDTIARVVAAAQVHFGDRGYAGARLTEIAKAAGITHSSIYQYFESKEHLYRAAYQAAQEELVPDYVAAIESHTALKDRVAALLRASVEIDERHPEITPFLASVPIELRRHPELAAGLEDISPPLIAALGAMFADATERGELPSGVDATQLMTAFLGAAMGVGLLSYGLGGGQMRPAIEVLLSAFDGDLFS